MPAPSPRSEAPSWRSPTSLLGSPASASFRARDQPHASRTDKPHDNWRATLICCHVVQAGTLLRHAQPLSIATSQHKPARAVGPGDNTSAAKPSLLSSSFKREQASVLSTDWVPGHHLILTPNQLMRSNQAASAMASLAECPSLAPLLQTQRGSPLQQLVTTGRCHRRWKESPCRTGDQPPSATHRADRTLPLSSPLHQHHSSPSECPAPFETPAKPARQGQRRQLDVDPDELPPQHT